MKKIRQWDNKNNEHIAGPQILRGTLLEQSKETRNYKPVMVTLHFYHMRIAHRYMSTELPKELRLKHVSYIKKIKKTKEKIYGFCLTDTFKSMQHFFYSTDEAVRDSWYFSIKKQLQNLRRSTNEYKSNITSQMKKEQQSRYKKQKKIDSYNTLLHLLADEKEKKIDTKLIQEVTNWQTRHLKLPIVKMITLYENNAFVARPCPGNILIFDKYLSFIGPIITGVIFRHYHYKQLQKIKIEKENEITILYTASKILKHEHEIQIRFTNNTKMEKFKHLLKESYYLSKIKVEEKEENGDIQEQMEEENENMETEDILSDTSSLTSLKDTQSIDEESDHDDPILEITIEKETTNIFEISLPMIVKEKFNRLYLKWAEETGKRKRDEFKNIYSTFNAYINCDKIEGNGMIYLTENFIWIYAVTKKLCLQKIDIDSIHIYESNILIPYTINGIRKRLTISLDGDEDLELKLSWSEELKQLKNAQYKNRVLRILVDMHHWFYRKTEIIHNTILIKYNEIMGTIEKMEPWEMPEMPKPLSPMTPPKKETPVVTNHHRSISMTSTNSNEENQKSDMHWDHFSDLINKTNQQEKQVQQSEIPEPLPIPKLDEIEHLKKLDEKRIGILQQYTNIRYKMKRVFGFKYDQLPNCQLYFVQSILTGNFFVILKNTNQKPEYQNLFIHQFNHNNLSITQSTKNVCRIVFRHYGDMIECYNQRHLLHKKIRPKRKLYETVIYTDTEDVALSIISAFEDISLQTLKSMTMNRNGRVLG